MEERRASSLISLRHQDSQAGLAGDGRQQQEERVFRRLCLLQLRGISFVCSRGEKGVHFLDGGVSEKRRRGGEGGRKGGRERGRRKGK